MRDLCGSTSAIERVPYEHVYGRSFEDMRRRVPSLEKIGRVVGYRPEVRLDQLLEITIHDSRERAALARPSVNPTTPAGAITA